MQLREHVKSVLVRAEVTWGRVSCGVRVLRARTMIGSAPIVRDRHRDSDWPDVQNSFY